MDTGIEEIADYWGNHSDECGLSVDWIDAKSLCWRCAHKRKLQRCHIIPRALGGSEDPSNLVLLCAQCHSEAPNVNDSEFMWVWLRAHAADFYGTYWQNRGYREYEFIYGRVPFSSFDKSLMLKIKLALKRLFKDTSTHWGQGKVNPATLAWLFRKIEIEVLSQAHK